jgi:hypothetical protein
MWPAMRNHIVPYMAHVIQVALGAYMSSIRVKGHRKSWEVLDGQQQFGENESTDIGKSRILPKEGKASINTVLAMQLGLALIFETVYI